MRTTLVPAAVGTPELRELRAEVRAFLQESIANGVFVPKADSWQSSINTDFSRMLGERGWIGMTIPKEYGGHGRSALERFVVTEELLAHGAPVAAHWIADRQMAASILSHGTEEQKQKYLPGIARGERYFGIGMSEPDSGSDLASVRTRATRDGTRWRISGTKLWMTSAHVATNMIVLVRTDEGERHQGLSQFVVDLPNPGIQINPIITVDGEHHFNEVVFDDAILEADALLGERGAGWRQVTGELANERSGPERLLSPFPLLAEWAKNVDADDAPATLELGRLFSRVMMLRQMSLGVARKLAAGQQPALEAALVKDLGTTFEGDLVETVRRMAMTEPLSGTTAYDKLLADGIRHSPAFTLRGGTNEVLRSIIAKGL
ncbi:acyl-CoA dehydrogenase family protein [Mycolicibacterium diernhoferi]|uniref:Acyl-CoA dehydrogenase n=1 Tax=Mycolicibacterium diernhoferi TaxID=1801 RepID=A0A1Q4HEE9_9MYCO|nr:acyl-CoA dehydrogenase family protein [Mycolicibacterium diernhoferi]OJZ65898.1 acyl-CoA dehydrogenase [Mycolicibacterium diernhoferi]OPE53659.1 acyl-CoA dehydrogenase [Mycolicibacterium diernhoferi]PEG53274.1 acyl-CoA dehydrogenase [Mycolicibacterium diernhoferi]QYL23804.1 acyl-CoA dehydrogenase family protein [Mycolicibacterium diernhoferi]